MSKLLSNLVSGITLDLKCNYSRSKAQPDLTRCLQYQLVKLARVFGGLFGQNAKVFTAECIRRSGVSGATRASTVTNLAAKVNISIHISK